jgi:hypothetical protein
MALCLQDNNAIKATKKEQTDTQYMGKEGEESKFLGNINKNKNVNKENNEVPGMLATNELIHSILNVCSLFCMYRITI